MMWLRNLFRRKDTHREAHRQALEDREQFLKEREHYDRIAHEQEAEVLRQKERLEQRRWRSG